MTLPLLVILALLGFLLQSGMGLLLALRRPLSPIGVLLLPLLTLLVGSGWSAWQAQALYGQALESLDDPALSWTLLEGRAHCWQGMLVGGLGATVLVWPLLAGTAVGSLRARVPKGKRRSWMPSLVAALGAFPGPVVLWMGLLRGEGTIELGIPATILPLLLVPGILGLGAPGTRPLAASGLLTGLLGLLIGSYGLLQWWVPEVGPAMRETLLQHLTIQTALNLGVFASALAVMPGWLAGATHRSSLSVVAAPLGTMMLQALLFLPMGVVGLRLSQLGQLAGMYELTLAQVSTEMTGTTTIPHQEGLPGRVLIASKYVPHWIERSETGVVSSKLSGELIDAGPSFRRGDGLLIPAEMTMGDFYLMISGSDVGELSLVGCSPVDWGHLKLAAQDPLLSAGWCGSLPLHLRLGVDGKPERQLILLKDKQVDDDGEIKPISALTETGSLLLRAQVDATVADLEALLTKMPGVTLYLGWGVQLDGEALPVGVEM